MKSIIVSIFLLFSVAALMAQEESPAIYNPAVDAKAEIQKAVKQAKEDGKHVLVQIGGNW
jgi:hypothetical protein